MTQHEDDRFDGWLRDASAGYNAPPPNAEVPREEMWKQIVVARAEARVPRASRLVPRSTWALAAAAVLLLAVGIGIGRMTQSDTAVGGLATAPVADSGAPGPYDVASTRHLTNAEAFVTSVLVASETPADTAMQRWARELLTDTRLLLDSPAGSDAQRRQLLEDLELLLVQIMQLEHGRGGETDAVLRETIRHDQLLMRLRASAPAGRPARS